MLSIVPGALHGWSGKVLRWPILAVTYLIITVELAVYVCIRCIIRIAEWAIAFPNHRQLLCAMAQAQSYETHATTFYQSQNVMCGFMIIVKSSRTAPIPLVTNNTKKMLSQIHRALAVIQQSTRGPNVGGIMSSDLFSYSNTGEPKHIVKTFYKKSSPHCIGLLNKRFVCNNCNNSQ